MLSEVDEVKPNHKNHATNINAYHRYVTWFERDGKAYYLRFTVQKMRPSKKGVIDNIVHSSFVSEVSVYEQGAVSNSARGQDYSQGLKTEKTAPLGTKLAQQMPNWQRGFSFQERVRRDLQFCRCPGYYPGLCRECRAS